MKPEKYYLYVAVSYLKPYILSRQILKAHVIHISLLFK